MNTTDYIAQLEETIIRITKERDDAINERDDAFCKRDKAINKFRKLEKKYLVLLKKLAFYEGPHTPSSKVTLKKKNKNKSNTSRKKRGAPKGHKGATRKRPEPEETIPATLEFCPHCNHRLGEPIATETKIIEDIPPPQKIKVTQFELDIYKCSNCGAKVKAKHKDCPEIGGFGIYLLVYITMLKFHLRGVLRKIQDYLLYRNNFGISVKGILDVLLRVGEVCKTEYGNKLEKIRNAKWRHLDETGFKVNGEKWWLWIFRSNVDDILVVIRNSRGRKVLNEILGEEHNGPDVVDGWSAYKDIGMVQRCWSHLIREVDEYKDVSENGKRLSEEIHASFKALIEFLDKDPPMDDRVQQKAIFDKQLENLVDTYSRFEELNKPLTYIRNGFGSWYTCVVFPGMEPTNNLAEQAIREHVIMRKIIGCFRSENGAENYQYIASLLATWKLQNKNGFEELEHLLRRELCLR